MRARIFCFLFLSWNEERRAPSIHPRARKRRDKRRKARDWENRARARTYLKIAVSLSVINPDGNCSSSRRSLTRCFLSLSFLAAHREESLLLREHFFSLKSIMFPTTSVSLSLSSRWFSAAFPGSWFVVLYHARHTNYSLGPHKRKERKQSENARKKTQKKSERKK